MLTEKQIKSQTKRTAESTKAVLAELKEMVEKLEKNPTAGNLAALERIANHVWDAKYANG